MKTKVVIQARMTSSRLPGKVLLPVLGKPLLSTMIDRLSRMKTIDGIIVATTDRDTDDPVEKLARAKGADCFRGSEEDVLDRVLKAARKYEADLIVETTADCPLIDPVECDKVVRLYRSGGLDYAGNCTPHTYPRGMDTQVFSRKTLEDVARRTNDPVDHEHVSYYIYQHPEFYRLGCVTPPAELERPELRLTVDTPEDFALVSRILEGLSHRGSEFSLAEVIHYLDAYPKLKDINRHVQQKRVAYA